MKKRKLLAAMLPVALIALAAVMYFTETKLGDFAASAFGPAFGPLSSKKVPSLEVDQSAVPVLSHQLLGGTLADSVLRLQFTAKNDDIDVTRVTFTGSGGGFLTTVDRLELFKSGDTAPFALATVAACGSAQVLPNSMCAVLNAQELVVPQSGNVDVIVRPRMRTDDMGAVSGPRFSFNILVSSVAEPVSAKAVNLGTQLLRNNGDRNKSYEIFIGTHGVAMPDNHIRGRNNHVVLAKLSSVTNANPDADGTPVPTGLTPFFQLKFSAAQNVNTRDGLNKWMLTGLVVNVNATNVLMQTNTFFFYNKADATRGVSCQAKRSNGMPITALNVSGSFLVQCNLNMSVDTAVDSGAEQTFVLRGSVTNPKINPALPSSLQGNLELFNDILATWFGASGSHLMWFDKDAVTMMRFFWAEYTESIVRSTLYNS